MVQFFTSYSCVLDCGKNQQVPDLETDTRDIPFNSEYCLILSLTSVPWKIRIAMFATSHCNPLKFTQHERILSRLRSIQSKKKKFLTEGNEGNEEMKSGYDRRHCLISTSTKSRFSVFFVTFVSFCSFFGLRAKVALCSLIAFFCLLPTVLLSQETRLQDQLMAEGTKSLVAAARREGDPLRGAVLFHQPFLACAKCHTVGQTSVPTMLGPDLTRPEPNTSAESIIESVLVPSKVLRKGFEPVVVQTTDGKTVTGLISEETATTLVLRDAGRFGETVSISKSQIEERVMGKTSMMPTGQVNVLGSRQQFLDLAKYLIEIAEQGAERARQLQPAASLFTFVLPEYERQLDHAGILNDLDVKAFKRGEAIYNRLCINCHGTKDQPGSLPTSLNFAKGKFKNGYEPYRMYQTLTHGFGLMAPQTWMVPQQKYDVIHYIRETYQKPHNPTQFVSIDSTYLETLPKGSTRGPAPSNIEPWSSMNYGPFLMATYEVGNDGSNFAQKGIATRLDPGPGGVSRGNFWQVFDHDTLRVAAGWYNNRAGGKAVSETANFIDWHGINFDGQHQIHPRLTGQVQFANPSGPGWADPITGSFADVRRIQGRDQRHYGPLPRDWGRYRGLYQHGDQVVLSYAIGSTDVLEMPGVVQLGDARTVRSDQADKTVAAPATPIFTRSFQIGPRQQSMRLKVATNPSGRSKLETIRVEQTPGKLLGRVAILEPIEPAVAEKAESPAQLEYKITAAGLSPMPVGVTWELSEDSSLVLRLPAGTEPLKFVLATTTVGMAYDTASLTALVTQSPLDLTRLTQGGPRRWMEELTTDVAIGANNGPFAVDVFSMPINNPWFAQLRLTGFDFFSDGDRLAVCSWDGDVWIVSGLLGLDKSNGKNPSLKWRRFANGLFQPLGLKIVDDQVYVTCRDQIAILRDLNQDGEADFVECFNNDHQVTEHFHEFAMGLQTDGNGDFYYAKSGRHALPAVVPHHGTLLRVTKDGTRTEILATGFRAANGVCLNPDGTFVVTDQEGFWNPKNRINWVVPAKPGMPPKFYGNMFGYHDVNDSSDSAMEPPLCWITNAFDRSPAELLWVTSDKWGPLQGSLLNLSYGYGKVFIVPHEHVQRPAANDSSADSAAKGKQQMQTLVQGGMCELPLPTFPTGTMRGRFHPVDGQLYTCGMFAWAGNATQPGGFYRIRMTGQAAHVPLGLKAKREGMEITFSNPLDPASASDKNRFKVRTWSLKRTAEYGSKHYDERDLEVTAVRLSEDHRTVTVVLPDLKPTWCMSIEYNLTGSKGEPVHGLIHNTIHVVND